MEPASSLVGNNAALIPELSVRWLGGSASFSEGLWPVDLNAGRAMDARWAKHPLRDVPKGVSGTVMATDCGKDGMCEVLGIDHMKTLSMMMNRIANPDLTYGKRLLKLIEKDGYINVHMELSKNNKNVSILNLKNIGDVDCAEYEKYVNIALVGK
jgi:hypothetical protein